MKWKRWMNKNEWNEWIWMKMNGNERMEMNEWKWMNEWDEWKWIKFDEDEWKLMKIDENWWQWMTMYEYEWKKDFEFILQIWYMTMDDFKSIGITW